MSETLATRKCVPCEGGIPKLENAAISELLQQVPAWSVDTAGLKLVRMWKGRDFRACLDFFERLATLAEAEGHHPDLHLTGYNVARVEVTTHAVGGLTENDFILAAKIDEVPPPG